MDCNMDVVFAFNVREASVQKVGYCFQFFGAGNDVQPKCVRALKILCFIIDPC